MTEDRTALLGLDWGTTSLRAYRIGADGRPLERRDAARGILNVAGGAFADALEEVVGDWLARWPGLPVLAAGMIGSRQGWQEVPYADCPAGAAEIAAGIAPIPGSRVRLVPGLSRRGDGDVPDVMRGEETQILGALAGAGAAEGLFVLPGTHSKWAWASGGRIDRFATYMTGEVYAVLRQHSILGRLMQGEAGDEAAFRRGLDRARRSAAADGAAPGALLLDIFSARTLGLLGDLDPAAIGSYLSGLLIGAEVAAALRAAGAAAASRGVTILGGAQLAGLYRLALDEAAIPAVAGDSDAAARGLHLLARAAGLIEG